MAHPGRQTIISSNLWVLEYLLEQDKVEDELIKHFYDGFLCDVGELPPPIQVRLMLRVLRDNVANITQSSLDALNCLTNFSHESPDLYPPACRVEDLSPALELYVQVKTDLVLRSLRDAGGVLAGPTAVTYNALVDKYFPQPPSESESSPMELHRREELKEAVTSSDKAQELLQKYSLEALGESLLAYVTKARAALGPPLLKVLESDVATGRYMPYMTGSESGVGLKRSRGPDAVGDLQHHSKQLRMLGQDPLPGTLHQAQLAGVHQGPFSQALQAAVGEQVPGGVLVGTEGGRPVYWDSPQATPDGVKIDLPVAPGMVAPLDGTPDDQGVSGTPEGGKKNKSGGPRRKVGRWSEEETNTLILLTNQLGKGKWKKILDEAGDIFKSRSQVDLKDKWRNLERQGIVQAPVKTDPGSGDNTGETVAEATEQQQGGGEMIENADAPDNPDGYLAEEGGAGAERASESEALATKA
ncbi:hypothetical protein ABBQ32_008790 [Trebouxia sp. C0010 RCD-2024]